jgi:hypothetical protein
MLAPTSAEVKKALRFSGTKGYFSVHIIAVLRLMANIQRRIILVVIPYSLVFTNVSEVSVLEGGELFLPSA